MDPLALLDAWPVTNCAAAVVGPHGLLSGRGDLDRPYPLASVTKPLVALAVLVAVEEGVVVLDEPAGPPGATVAHLLAHGAGLAPDERQVVAPPGTKRIYSNAGYEVLAEHVSAEADLAFDDYLAEAIAEPLGLRCTRLEGSAAHGAVGSVGDLARVIAELLDPAVLAEETVAEATTVVLPGLSGVLPGYGHQEHNDWGLGFEIRNGKHPHWTGSANSPATYGHFGRSGTMFWVDPAAGIGLVALADREFGPWAVDAWPTLSDAVLTGN